MRVRELVAGDVEGWVAVRRAAGAVDAPDRAEYCRADFVGELAAPWPGERFWYRVAEVDGQIVGTVCLELPEVDNVQNASLELTVHPTYRRRGIGTALHEAAVAEARRADRRWLMSYSVRGLAGGPARNEAGGRFAAGTGAKLAQSEIGSRQDLSTVDRKTLDGQIRELAAGAAGYSLVSWTGAAPDDIVADLAEMDSSFVAEAPMGDLAWEPEKIDIERFREIDRCIDARRHRAYHSAVRHDGSGEAVAWTCLIGTQCQRDRLRQEITLVRPAHRGHRLGMLVKLGNLARAWDAVPELTAVDTENAQENAHMIAINTALGYRPVDVHDAWQLAL